MAITVVQTKSGVADNTTTCAVEFDSPVTAGSLLIATVYAYQTTSFTFSSVGDDNGNTWTTDRADAYTNPEAGFIASAPNANSGTTEFTVTSSGNVYFSVVLWEVSGMATSSPFDQGNNQTDLSTSPNSGNITTTEDNEIIIGMMVHGSGATSLTIHGDYTLAHEGEGASNPYNAGHRIVSATGTYAVSWTTGAAVGWFAIVGSYKADDGAPAPTTRSWGQVIMIG